MSKKKYNLNTIYISERLQEKGGLKPISQSAIHCCGCSHGIWKNNCHQLVSGQTEQKRKFLCDPNQYLF